MKSEVQNDKFGKILYEEGFWTGRKNISINGVPATKISRTEFRTESGVEIYLKGNYLTGVSATFRESCATAASAPNAENAEPVAVGAPTEIQLLSKLAWWEIALSLLPFILIMIWGSIEALVLIVPVVGGLIGGFVSILFSFVSVMSMRAVKQVWLKIVIALAMTGLAFLSCYLIALGILLPLAYYKKQPSFY